MYRKAWLGYALALVVAVAGFWPSFYAGRQYPLDWIHVAHGLLATAWMVLLVVQGWLIAYRHNRLHRSLGWISVIIAPLFVLSGLGVEHAMLQPGGMPLATKLKLTWLDLWTLALFSGLFAMAVVKRKRVVDHARYVTATVVILMPPAIGRLMGGAFSMSLGATLLPITLILGAVVVAMMVFDWRRRNLIHPAYVATLALLVGTQLTYPLTAQPWFHAFGRWIGGT